jgi:PAS domain S-box-containing protein
MESRWCPKGRTITLHLLRISTRLNRAGSFAHPDAVFGKGAAMNLSAMNPSVTQYILCIDDEASGLKLRRLILERKGYMVSTAATVSEALALFRSRDFDLVATDHLLGRETGTAMAKVMKRLKPNIPIILLSGTTNEPESFENIDAFISKAEGTESLLAKVTQLIVRSEAAKASHISDPPTGEEPFPTESQRVQLLAAIVQSSDDAIFSKTLDGTILSWNKAAERMYGYRAEEIIRKRVSVLLPSDRPNEIHEILNRLRHGERIEHFETVRVPKDGRLLSVSLTISPIHDYEGRIIGASTIARDITRSKLAEQALRNSEKLATAGRMAATVAHEINNPLEAVTNALYLLAESPSLDASARQFLTIAQDELAKIRQVTTLTLGLHRGDAERPHQVKVSGLIDNVLALYGRKLRTLGIAVETRYDADVPVNAFPGELRQVLSNVIVNAADALEKSGDKLCIHVLESLDWTNLTQRGLRITISDNGCGIPFEKRAQMFEPFFTTKGNRGTGIGLWVSLGIVKKYGGRIRYRSEVKQGRSGTIFSIFLPVTQLA